jgi:hypothetical protein
MCKDHGARVCWIHFWSSRKKVSTEGKYDRRELGGWQYQNRWCPGTKDKSFRFHSAAPLVSTHKMAEATLSSAAVTNKNVSKYCQMFPRE